VSGRTDLATRAELARLARLLGVEPAQVAGLAPAGPAGLRAVRERVTDVLHDAERPRLARLAAAADRLPAPLVATIGARVFGPLLCARVTALLAPQRAVAIAERLDPAFLAALAAELDPRRARPVLAAVPISLLLGVAREVVARDDLVTIGRFAGELNDEALRAALPLVDDHTLLRGAAVLEDRDRLGHFVELLPADRLLGVLRAATGGGGELLPEALDLLDHLDPAQQRRVAVSAAALDDEELDALVRGAAREDEWSALLPLLPLLDEATRARFAALEAVRDPAIEPALRAAAREHGVAEAVEAALAEGGPG
jgi:hypothetical protein